MATQRQRQVGELLREDISRILREEMSDPRVGFVTITDVEVSADLRHARVYVSVLGSPDEQNASLEALEGAAHFVRAQLAHGWTLRRLPEIEFRWDPSIERGARLMELLQHVKQEETDDDSEA
ncbi:ribosome-binding factor A [candidate division KD3-62 bacterium DG_56]|uniref:Ribosome-binding factor A n=1 Tax=candidate division KD3-62 bacterium DG_56 TaxID=1704032 RepID=A0A0S7XQ39_9BACT|nr:MAG: ribosome-binding factor A [candidate division KD3-62 bacterium DG_56]